MVLALKQSILKGQHNMNLESDIFDPSVVNVWLEEAIWAFCEDVILWRIIDHN